MVFTHVNILNIFEKEMRMLKFGAHYVTFTVDCFSIYSFVKACSQILGAHCTMELHHAKHVSQFWEILYSFYDAFNFIIFVIPNSVRFVNLPAYFFYSQSTADANNYIQSLNYGSAE